MQTGVACGTECDQVFFRIFAGMAAEFLVVNLEIRHCAARLASPAIAPQYLVAELFVQVGTKA